MKNVKFTILPPIGSGETHKHGTVKDLLFEIPYLFIKNRKNLIPPIYILNDLLKSGIKDAAMSGGIRWKPFEVSEEEYRNLVEELSTEPNYELALIETPKKVKNFEQWAMWRISALRKL